MAIKKKKVKTFTKPMKDVDEEIYPEFYRKKGDNHKRATPDPFHIVIIKKIFEDCGELKLEVRVLYRPEDTHEGASAAESALANELFWTEETASVGFDRVEGRAYVKFFDSTISDEHICCWTEAGPHRWFFRSCYDPSMGQFEIVDTGYRPKEFLFPTYPQGVRKLRCLNIFSGCGGLSHGLCESGVADTKWAVEIFEPAAKAYKLNNPECTVFGDDCNLLLKRAMEGASRN